jgi:hypothetical protein
MPEKVQRWPEPASLEAQHGAVGGIAFQNPDEVLWKVARCPDVKVYETMQASFPAAYGAYSQRTVELLSKGWEVQAGEGPMAEMAANVMRALLESVASLPTVLEELHRAHWTGYGVHVTRSTREISMGRRKIRAPWHMARKPPQDFGFTVDRRLVWNGTGTAGEQVFETSPELGFHQDQLRFLTPSTTTDNPYGFALASIALLPWRVWKGTAKDRATGLHLSSGVWIIKDKMMPVPGQQAGVTQERASASAEILKLAVRAARESGILQLPAGIDAELMNVEDFTRDGVTFLRYWDELVSRVILGGQSLSTTLDGEGSRAATATQRRSLISLCKADGWRLFGWLTEWLMPWVEINLGMEPGAMPLRSRPKIVSLLADAPDLEIVKILLDGGMPVDAVSLAQSGNVTLAPEPGEELVIRKRAAEPEPELEQPEEEPEDEEEVDEPADEND